MVESIRRTQVTLRSPRQNKGVQLAGFAFAGNILMKAPHTEFGETKMFPVVTFTDGKQDAEPRSTWQKTMWVERGEDYYAFLNAEWAKGTVRVIDRREWLKCRDTVRPL